MNLIVLLFFSSFYLEGNCQLVRRPRLLPNLQGDISNVEPYEIHTIKRTLSGEKQTKLKLQESAETSNTEKLPQTNDQDNHPGQRLKYTRNKSHMLDAPTIHIDTENAIIDYEKNDTIATQRQIVEIESMIIKHSADETNLLDSLLNKEDDNDKGIENMNNTRRLISGTIPRHDFDVPDADLKSLPNNPPIESKNDDTGKGPLYDDTNDQHYDNGRISSSSPLNELSDKLEDDRCIDTSDDEKSEVTDREAIDEIIRKNTPTSGRGITDLVKSRMMLFNHPRVCYACNSNQDKSCWSPNRRTSVKYCQRNHKNCLIKVYENGGTPEVIRDCGESCSAISTVATGEAYASCTICHTDLCNGAGGLAIQNIGFVIVAINIIVKVSK